MWPGGWWRRGRVGSALTGSGARRWCVRRGASGPLCGLVGLPCDGAISWNSGSEDGAGLRPRSPDRVLAGGALDGDGWGLLCGLVGLPGGGRPSLKSGGSGGSRAGPVPIGSGARRWRRPARAAGPSPRPPHPVPASRAPDASGPGPLGGLAGLPCDGRSVGTAAARAAAGWARAQRFGCPPVAHPAGRPGRAPRPPHPVPAGDGDRRGRRDRARGSRRRSCSRGGGTRCTYVRRHPPRRRSEAPPPHRDSAIRNNTGCFAPQCPSSRRARARAAAAVAHEAHRMARIRPWRRLFVHLVAAASARKTGIGPQKPTPPGRGAPVGRARAPRATCRRPRPPIRRTAGPCGHPRPRPAALPPPCAGPAGDTATPSRPTGAGRSPMPVHPAMIANLWPRNTLTSDHKFAIDGPSRAESVCRAGFGAESSPADRLDGTGATYCRVSTGQRPQSGGNRALDAPTGLRRPNAVPAGRRHRRAPDPSTAGRTRRRPRRRFSPQATRRRPDHKAAQQTRPAPPQPPPASTRPVGRGRHPVGVVAVLVGRRHRRAPDPMGTGPTHRRPRRRFSVRPPDTRQTNKATTRPPSRPEPPPPPAATPNPQPPPTRNGDPQARSPRVASDTASDTQGRPRNAAA
ncbi:hypothetical protein EKD16_14710 [Streptomonospora litoralis]|uniref:Uncharacterized protein n=1 Tax=Streptomonospora litoralis TaxID=2498135 RepID=A0A4V0ZJU7_9ACTN|nr:hypothetical protein EKD16_14710 [Streptomonospora litoralis]